MGEVVVVHQRSDFGTVILAADAEHPESMELSPTEDIRSLTPYGMLLAGLGCCTAIILHTYARNHNVHLPEVELRLTYQRTFAEDCEHCETDGKYEESIEQEIILGGKLSPWERQRLLRVASYCPIHKILSDGIRVELRLAEGKAPTMSDQRE